MTTVALRSSSRVAAVVGLSVNVLSAAVAYATTTRSVSLTCPVCGEKVAALVIMSTNTFGGQDSDLLTLARGSQPILILPIACTNCYYAGYKDDFEKGLKAPDTVRPQLRKTLKPPLPIRHTGQTMDVPAWARYDLAAQTCTVTGQQAEVVAITYHRASWAVRLTADPLADSPEGVREKVRSLIQDRLRSEKRADNQAAQETEFGRQLTRQLDTASQPDRLVIGLAAIALLRRHGENPLAAETLGKLKGLMQAEDFQRLDKNLTESIERERTYQKKALALIEKLANDQQTKDEKRALFMYLGGELNRRLGQPQEARAWFQKAGEQKGPEWILELNAQQSKLVASESAPPGNGSK